MRAETERLAVLGEAVGWLLRLSEALGARHITTHGTDMLTGEEHLPGTVTAFTVGTDPAVYDLYRFLGPDGVALDVPSAGGTTIRISAPLDGRLPVTAMRLERGMTVAPPAFPIESRAARPILEQLVLGIEQLTSHAPAQPE